MPLPSPVCVLCVLRNLRGMMGKRMAIRLMTTPTIDSAHCAGLKASWRPIAIAAMETVELPLLLEPMPPPNASESKAPSNNLLRLFPPYLGGGRHGNGRSLRGLVGEFLGCNCPTEHDPPSKITYTPSKTWSQDLI